MNRLLGGLAMHFGQPIDRFGQIRSTGVATDLCLLCSRTGEHVELESKMCPDIISKFASLVRLRDVQYCLLDNMQMGGEYLVGDLNVFVLVYICQSFKGVSLMRIQVVLNFRSNKDSASRFAKKNCKLYFNCCLRSGYFVFSSSS